MSGLIIIFSQQSFIDRTFPVINERSLKVSNQNNKENSFSLTHELNWIKLILSFFITHTSNG